MVRGRGILPPGHPLAVPFSPSLAPVRAVIAQADVVLAIGFDKLQEGHTTGGITNMADPLWGRSLQTGALTGTGAQKIIDEFGVDRERLAAMKYRTIMDEHAMRNKKAHRRLRLERKYIKETADNSPATISHPARRPDQNKPASKAGRT